MRKGEHINRRLEDEKKTLEIKSQEKGWLETSKTEENAAIMTVHLQKSLHVLVPTPCPEVICDLPMAF